MTTYNELLEKDFARQIKFNHVEDYHKLGYKGEGVVIFNAEENNDHMLMTNKVINLYGPKATVINGVIGGRSSGDVLLDSYATINNIKYELEEAIDKFNIKIITRSYSGSSSGAMLAYFRDIQKRKRVIFFCSAGNDIGDVGCWARGNTAITVAAVKIKDTGEIVLSRAESPGEVDFSSFMAKGTGTSAAAPALATKAALLINRYGDINQEECIEIFKKYSVPLGDPIRFGYGIPVLPLEDRLEILEKLRGEKMADFKDVEQDRWSKPAIDCLVERGELRGFEDGTFRPNEPLTREQYAQARYNQLKLEGKI